MYVGSASPKAGADGKTLVRAGKARELSPIPRSVHQVCPEYVPVCTTIPNEQTMEMLSKMLESGNIVIQACMVAVQAQQQLVQIVSPQSATKKIGKTHRKQCILSGKTFPHDSRQNQVWDPDASIQYAWPSFHPTPPPGESVAIRGQSAGSPT